MAANPSTKNAHEQLIDRLLANLPSGHTEETVKLPNRSFTTPSGSKWLRVTVIVGDSNNVQAGGLWIRTDGIFVIDSFYPTGNDTLVQIEEAEVIAAVFENQKFNGVNVQETLITEPGESGSWYNVQISCDFYFEGKK